MGSILTNNSAMVALETLRSINRGLQTVQSQVSTGKQVANAKDNAAFWAISQVMQSDVSAFKGISETLSLGQSSLAVARSGAETVTDLLNEMKGRIVAAQEQNVDRSKIQADVLELRNQTVATVNASQFNGLNLLQNVTNNGTVNVLASLNRSTSGVTTSEIAVDRKSLEVASTTGAQVNSIADGSLAATTVLTIGAPATYRVGDVIALRLSDGLNTDGAIIQTTITAADIALATDAALTTAVVGRLNTELTSSGYTRAGLAITAATNTIQVASGANPTTFNAQAAQGGGLAALSLVDVSTAGGAAAALYGIEKMIQTSIDAAAAMGSSGKRVEIQREFVSKLSDALKSGIGAIVDADMEAASARLQALQVQQQLGTQALSIANQQPQSILSLFR